LTSYHRVPATIILTCLHSACDPVSAKYCYNYCTYLIGKPRVYDVRALALNMYRDKRR